MGPILSKLYVEVKNFVDRELTILKCPMNVPLFPERELGATAFAARACSQGIPSSLGYIRGNGGLGNACASSQLKPRCHDGPDYGN
jgi:hypothetical protein